MKALLRFLIWASLVCAVVVLSGCATNPSNQQRGTVVGGIIGTVGGALLARGPAGAVVVILGALAGASIGHDIGRSMDEADRMKLGQVLERSPSHRTTSWENARTGYRYTVTPSEPQRSVATSYSHCRRFAMQSRLETRRQESSRIACRRYDGKWRVQS